MCVSSGSIRAHHRCLQQSPPSPKYSRSCQMWCRTERYRHPSDGPAKCTQPKLDFPVILVLSRFFLYLAKILHTKNSNTSRKTPKTLQKYSQSALKGCFLYFWYVNVHLRSLCESYMWDIVDGSVILCINMC